MKICCFSSDTQTTAHGHYCHCRTTGQPRVVQYYMLDASCPSGNYSPISSLDRFKRSASSRYKKNLALRNLNYSQVNLIDNSIQSWQ